MPTPREPSARHSGLVGQLIKFSAVGGVGVVVNLAVFNLLLFTVFNPRNLHFGSLYASAVATIVAIFVNWLGNRYWAFAAQRQSNTVREGVEFFVVSLIGMAFPLLCVWVSHYVLHLTSPLADNIANNVVGLVLGALFRFALYRWWVFSPTRGTHPAMPPADGNPVIASASEIGVVDSGVVNEG